MSKGGGIFSRPRSFVPQYWRLKLAPIVSFRPYLCRHFNERRQDDDDICFATAAFQFLMFMERIHI